MEIVTSRITVLFEEPFWVCIYERREDGGLQVCRVVFGAEPKDYDVYSYLLANWATLRFSPPVADTAVERKTNPKRLQRLIRRELQKPEIGTKAQQALKLQHEQSKQERTANRSARREEEKDRRFEERQLKKRKKHKGR